MSIDYKEKYIKYKNKYNNLKLQGGEIEDTTLEIIFNCKYCKYIKTKIE